MHIEISILLISLYKHDAAPQYDGDFHQDVCYSKNPCPGLSQICINADKTADGYICKCADDYSYKWDSEKNDCYCVFEEGFNRCHFCKSRDVTKRLRDHREKEILFCKEELKECRVTRVQSGYMPDEEYINMNQAGNGYNILLASPLEIGRRDKGHRNLQLFKPFSYAQDNTDDCVRHGFSSPHKGKSCQGRKVSKVYTSISDVETEVKEIFSRDNRQERASIDVSEYQNAQFSNAIAFGTQVQLSNDSSDSETASHCIDEAVAKSTSTGGSIEKNGQSTELDSKSNTDLKTGNSLNEMSRGTSGTSGSQWQLGGGISANAQVPLGLVSAGAGVSFGGGYGRSKSNTETDGIGNSKNDGYEANKSIKDESSHADGWSAIENKDKSSSRTITTNVCKNRNSDSSLSRTSGKTDSESNSSEKEQSKKKSFIIPGYLNSIQSIKQVNTLGRFLNDTKKMISYSTAKCTVWSMRMLPNVFPTYSEDFKAGIRKLHYASERNKFRLKIKKIADWTFETTLDEVQERDLDNAFSEFIANYGTHFFTSVEFGGGSVDEFRMTHSSSVRYEDEESKDCMEDILQDKLGEKLSSKISSNKCKNPVLKEELSRSAQINVMNSYSEGSALLDTGDVVGYTQDRFDNPVPVKFELQPIITIFQSEMMSIDRISTDEGEPIDAKSIFSWFLPRYVILLGRCAALGNYTLADNGASCIECPHHLVPSYDRTECVEPGQKEGTEEEPGVLCLTTVCIKAFFKEFLEYVEQHLVLVIVVGILLAVVLIVLCSLCCYCRRRCKSSRREQATEGNIEAETKLMKEETVNEKQWN